jgi:hypothetical protein
MSGTNSIPRGEVLLYESGDGSVQVNVRLDRESVWLTQEQMSTLFNRERSVITKHIRNVFAKGELEREAYVQNLHILPLTVRLTRSSTTTSMSSSRSATGSSRCKAPASASGPRGCCASI